MDQSEPVLRIDCDDCVMVGTDACSDCIVTYLCNRDDGGADMVIFDTPGGGAVFSAASITWPASILVDDAVSRITANVLRRFVDASGRITSFTVDSAIPGHRRG